MNTESVAVPVLIFSPNYETMEFVRDKDLLSVTNKLGLKKGIVIGNFVVDSLGRIYKTTNAKKKGNYHPSWKFEFFNPLIYIELEVEKVKEELDLSEVKEKVLRIVRRDRAEWANYGDVNEIKKSIEASRTYRQLIEIIGTYIHPLSER